MTDYPELLEILKECHECICEAHCPYYADRNNPVKCMTKLVGDAADVIEEMNRGIDRAIELYNRNVEKSAMYEALAGISPEPPKEERE